MDHPHLEASDLDPNPIAVFCSWYEGAIRAGQPEPDATALGTSTPEGRSSVRFVLLKDVGERGFVFYTNRRSRKAGEIAATGWASMAFRWPVVSRQVRVAGPVGPLVPEESEEYFAARDRGSQLGAWASRQSEVLGTRAELEARLAEVTARYEGGPVPRPPWWGGYRIDPYEIEFWQQGEFRLHDRFRYLRRELAPGSDPSPDPLAPDEFGPDRSREDESTRSRGSWSLQRLYP
jgi:pyridoxamine 5'-phosphate oxidase